MKKSYVILLFLNICICSSIFGQNYATDAWSGNVTNSIWNVCYDGKQSHFVDYKDIKGSPYLVNNYDNGVVHMKDGNSYMIPLKYDIYKNTFEFKEENSGLEIDKPEDILKIELGTRTYVYYKLNKRKLFVEMIAIGEKSLVCVRQVTLKKAEEPAPYKEPKPAQFIKEKEQYFIVDSDNKAHFIRNKKTLLKGFSEKKIEIAKYIKGEKINYKKRLDLKKVVEYYNKL